MLTVWFTRSAPAAVVLAAITWLGPGTPAASAGPLDPADPCADAASVACQQHRRQTSQLPAPGQADRWCGPHHGVHVPCSAGPAGIWVGDPPVVYGFPATTGYPTSQLMGCWARSLGAPTPRPRPDLAMFDASDLNLFLAEPSAALVQAAHPGNVHTVLVAGHIVKRDKRLVGLDLEHLRGKARDANRRLLRDG